MATTQCSDAHSDTTSPPPPPGGCGSAQDLASCLPSWQQYSPKQNDEAPTLTGTPTSTDATHTLDRIDTSGTTVSLGNVTFTCTDSTFNFVDNPDKAISFNLDETKIWPGALIQGKSHRDAKALSDVLELPIRERAPVTVTLTFNNQDNTRVVQNPEQGAVHQAVSSMIGNAQAESLATANNIDFHSEVYSSEKQAAKAFGISGRYLGFEASATGQVDRTATTNVVVAQFVQQMYIAGVTQPSTPASVFSADFTSAKYKEQADLGRIGA
ncbi:MAG TPA: thiol-activated cytolysin family protein, partial [Gemmatimonadaceae bacterium]